MPATIKPPTFTLLGQTPAYDATPKWKYAEALLQLLLHQNKEIRNHAKRREAALIELQGWLAHATHLKPNRNTSP